MHLWWFSSGVQKHAQAFVREGGQMGLTEEFLQAFLEGVVPLLQAKQVNGGKMIHEKTKQNTLFKK